MLSLVLLALLYDHRENNFGIHNMNKSAFGFMASAIIILSACTNFDGEVPKGVASNDQVTNYYPKYEQKETTLFDLGRSLSHNAVDIYDPASTTLSIPPEQPEMISPLSRFPAHTSMLIRDEDVVVYSLFSNHMTPDENLQPPDEILAPPLPLNSDDSQLPP